MWGGDGLRKPRGGGRCHTLHDCLRGWEETVESVMKQRGLVLFILTCTGGTTILIGKWK